MIFLQIRKKGKALYVSYRHSKQMGENMFLSGIQLPNNKTLFATITQETAPT